MKLANKTPNGDSPPIHILPQARKHTAVIHDVRIEEEINSRCDSPLMKKILSMPCDPQRDISIESGN